MFDKITKLILSIGVCLAAGFIGSIFTTSAIPAWYATLDKPVFSPPNWIFAPVWTTLYILMGISIYLVQSSKLKVQSEKTKVKNAVLIFWIQLFLNVVWSIIFFGLQNPTFALFEIIVLWGAIFLTIKYFYPISKLAAYLLIPYLIWVTFASILNLSIVLLN
jgi:translocator protein